MIRQAAAAAVVVCGVGLAMCLWLIDEVLTCSNESARPR